MNVLVCKLVLLTFDDDASVAGVMGGMMRKFVFKVRLMRNRATPSSLGAMGWTVRIETIAGDHKFAGSVYYSACQRIQTAR